MIVAILSLLCAGAAAQRDAISLDVRDARLIDVVFLLATQAGKNVIATQDAGKQHVTLHVRAEPFDQILQSLARMYGLQVANKGNVYLLTRRSEREPSAASGAHHVVISETDRRLPAAVVPARLPESVASPDTAMAARSIVLRRVTPSSAIASLRDVLPAATYIPDDRRRAVVIVANAGTVNLAGRLIKSADQPERRVLFDIRLFDVRLIVEEDNLGQELSDAPTPGVQTAMYAFVKDTHRLDSELRFLIGAGRAQALANWRLSVDVGEPAEVAVGERPTPLHSVDIGARLSAKAAIEGRTLFLEVHSAYRVPERFTRGAAVFANRDAAFNLRLRPDQSVVIGGLLKDVDSATIRSAPSLEQLPVLGAVFSNRRRAHIKDEACFVVTPRLAERGSSRS